MKRRLLVAMGVVVAATGWTGAGWLFGFIRGVGNLLSAEVFLLVLLGVFAWAVEVGRGGGRS